MSTSTSYEYAPLEYFTAGEAAMYAIPSRSVLGTFVKFGKNDKGQTIFEYIDPDKQWTEYKYPITGYQSWGSPIYDYNHPIVNPATGDYNWPVFNKDGTPYTNKTYLNTGGDSLAISADGRSLMSTVPAGQRSLSGMGAGMGYTLNGSGMDETLTFSGDNGWVSGKFTTPTYGVADVPTTGDTGYNLSDAYQKYLGQFYNLAKGVQSRITSKTVTDSGILGDIKDTIGKLGPLAPIALSFAFPGVGSAIGAALGATGATAAVIGNTLINTALNGGDVGKALSSSLIGATGLEAGSLASDIAKGGDFGSFLQSNPQYLSNLANNVTQAALKGQDVESALSGSLLGSGVSMATSEIPGYADLSPTVKASVDSAITQALQGKDVTMAAINAAIKAGQSAMATSTNVPTEEQALKDQQALQDQLAPYEDTTAPKPQTITGDDGSTVTLNPDGSITSTESKDTGSFVDSITGGTTTTGGTTAGGTTTGGTTTGGTTTGGTTTPTTTQPAALTDEQKLAGLASLLDSGSAAQTTTYTPSTGAASSGAAAIPTAVNYLGELGQAPRYLEELDPEVVNMLQQLGIDPQELMAQRDAESASENAGEGGEEVADTLEAPGGSGGFSTRAGIKRGLPAGTLGVAGPEVGSAYQSARADQGMDTSRAYKLPIGDYNRNYLTQLAQQGEKALGEQWAPLIAGRQLAGSGQPTADMTQSGNTLAYVPSASIGGYKGFTGALAPQLVAMVGRDPEMLTDPDYLAAVLGHELSHQPQQDAGQLMRDLGIHPGKVPGESAAMSRDIASVIPYLTEKYGYKGFYDTKANAPIGERLADIGGWQMQNQVNLTQDPTFLKQVLNTPERMAVYNAMMPQRGVQLDPSYPPVGQVSLEDFGGMNPPVGWAAKNLSNDQFKALLKKRLSGLFGQ